MILGMNGDALIRRLVSQKLYQLYINEAVLDLIKGEDGDKSKESSLYRNAQNVVSIAAMITKKAIEYTPVDTGKLVKSIYVKTVGSGIMIGYTAEYATYVHEIGFYNHEAPTKYKYLEDAAVEVAADTKAPFRISITYEPLAVYINVPKVGAELVDIKTKELQNRSIESKDKLWEDFSNYDPETATDDEKVYFDKMMKFFRYWGDKDYNSSWIMDEWQDRNRHE